MFNIFVLAFMAIFFGLMIAVWMTRKALPPGSGHVIPEEDSQKDPSEIRPLTLEDLKKLGKALCEENQLTIIETLPGEFEENWVLESQNPIFAGKFVFTFVAKPKDDPFVLLADLLQFKDFVKSMQAGKGFFFTSGYFTRDVHQPLEGVAVSLYNRLRVIEDLREGKIPL